MECLFGHRILVLRIGRIADWTLEFSICYIWLKQRESRPMQCNQWKSNAPFSMYTFFLYMHGTAVMCTCIHHITFLRKSSTFKQVRKMIAFFCRSIEFLDGLLPLLQNSHNSMWLKVLHSCINFLLYSNAKLKKDQCKSLCTC